MNHRLRTTLILLTVLLSLALLALGFFQGFEQETREVFTGYGERAMENDYLAAGWLLERLGLKVTFFENASTVKHLPQSDGTLIIPGSSRAFSEEQIGDLLEWMAHGGSLVVTVDVFFEENLPVRDRLLERFGIESRVLEKHMLKEKPELSGSRPLRLYDSRQAESAAKSASVSQAETASESQAETASVSAGRVSVPMDRAVVLIDSEDRAFWSTPENDVRMLHIRHGRGLLTVLSDSHFMSNRWINAEDGGRFLWYLATENGIRGGGVFIVYGQEFAPLLSIVARHGWPILISLSVLIASVIGFSAPRLGPMHRDPEPVRRGLTEHLDAVGRFLWGQGYRAQLVESVRRTVRRDICRKHPSWDKQPFGDKQPSWERLPSAMQLSRLELLLGLDREQLKPLTESKTRNKIRIDEKQFVDVITKLERIRASL